MWSLVCRERRILPVVEMTDRQRNGNGKKSKSFYMFAIGNYLQLINENIFQLLFSVCSPFPLGADGFPEKRITSVSSS